MKKKVLLSSIATIALCLCLIAGSTFALFTSQDKVGIEVTAANVKMTANISDLTLESVEANPNGTIVDEFGGKYAYKTCTGNFINGGTAIFDESTKTLNLVRVTPGDRVSFNVQGTNESDVTIQYRYIVECVGDALLMGGLNVTIDGVAYPALDSYTSVWTQLQPGQNITPELIVIELPVTAGNKYQEKGTSIKITVEAVQGNADIGENNAPVVEFLEDYNATAVSDLASLQAALDNAVEGDNIIVLSNDIAGDVTATQKANVKTTIYGNGNTFAGVFTVDGKSATLTSAGLTIKDLVFSADTVSADACVRLGDGTNATRYTCNVYLVGCTFDVPDVVGVKSYTGGDKNVSIINCTATARAHSLAQLKGVDGVFVENCTVNAVRGINLNNSNNVAINKSVFDVEKYAVRFGESANTIVETYAVTNCALTSNCVDGDAVIVLRAGATDANLTLTGTTLNGSIEMTGYENANIIK